jgi:peroxiredoxin
MPATRPCFLAAALLAATLAAQQPPQPQLTPAETAIVARLKAVRAQPDTTRPAYTRALALDIRALPAGLTKLRLANSLASLATEGDAGVPTLTDVTLTLAQALAENPIQPKPAQPGPSSDSIPDSIPEPYLEVARIVRYEHIDLDPKYLADPLFARADAELAHNDADIQHADFTLRDLDNHPVTLSSLRGKVVLVNFWATWCPPCRKEMPALNDLYNHFKSQGLVILSISDEDSAKVAPFIAQSSYHPTVLLDPGSTVHQQFHVEGIPKSFVFDRAGRLVSQTIDERTERQFLAMLTAAGLE